MRGEVGRGPSGCYLVLAGRHGTIGGCSEIGTERLWLKSELFAKKRRALLDGQPKAAVPTTI
jgi:hypothetical protein